MILIHAYRPAYVKKLFEAGIAQKGDGFKINQTFRAPEDKKFNEIAKEGSPFFHLVKECASCFYVDRLQGGTFYSRYDFDKELLDAYAEKTDAEFLGFQVHELGNTRAQDWKRIQRCLAADNLSWNEENIYNSVRKISANKDFPHFSQGPAGEYAALTPPKTVTQFVADLDYVLAQRQISTWGNVLKCDDGSMYCRSEDLHGIRTAFVEVGGQRPQIRLQFAFRRGLSRKSGKKWGTYIEPWGGKECTAYVYAKDGSNDWYRPTSQACDAQQSLLYKTAGENGGTSISLAGRLMFYALFSGSHYFAEEWGAANTFYDWQDGGLTPYGLYKQKMAALSRKLKHVQAMAPIAIILPKAYQLVLTHGEDIVFENDAVPGEYPDIVRRINRLFCSGSSLGHEDNLLTTGRYGSIFDIIYEDTYEHPEAEYDFLVDFSGRFAGRLPNAVSAYDEAAMLEKLDAFVADYLPFTCAGGEIDYMLFQNDGDKYCCILNHNGVSKSVEEGETVNPAAAVTMDIVMRSGRILEVTDLCDCGFATDGDNLRVTLPGGTFILFRYV